MRARLAAVLCVAGLAAIPSSAAAQQQADSSSDPSASGGAWAGDDYGKPTVPGRRAKLKNGIGYAPTEAPRAVQEAIWAANEIQDRPYRYGGGHGSFEDDAYDCSGTISYALHGGGLLDRPLDSRSFKRWGEAGAGDWITVYTNDGHAYAVLAGLRLDTSGAGEKGPRWRKEKRSAKGFKARHPEGL